jgi:hypothetical protein
MMAASLVGYSVVLMAVNLARHSVVPLVDSMVDHLVEMKAD